jgi:hypothetical protein
MSNDKNGADSTEENLEEGENLEENTSEEKEDSSELESKFEDQKKRAEKAEKKLEELRTRLSSNEDDEQESEKDTLKDDRGGLTKDEAKLYARGLSDEEIDKADKIAQVEGISLMEAVDNDIFVTWKEKNDKEEKDQQASIGASKGSGSQKKGKNVSDSGLSTEEHKALARKRMGL